MNDRNNEFDKLIEEYTKKAKVTTERNNELDILTMCHSFSNALRDNNNANEASVKEAKEQIKETEEQITASDIANKIINDAIKQQTDELNEILDKEKILLKTDNNELANLLYEHKKAYLIRINELVSIIRKGLEDLNLALTNSNSQLDEYLGKYELNKDRFNKTIENVLTRAQDILEIEDNKVLISENDATEEEKENTILETANNKEETAEIDTETKTADPEVSDNINNKVEEDYGVDGLKEEEKNVDLNNYIIHPDNINEDKVFEKAENDEIAEGENSFTPVSIEPDHIEADTKHKVINEETTDINQYKDPINDMLNNNNEEVVATNDKPTEVVNESPKEIEEVVITNDKLTENTDSYKATNNNGPYEANSIEQENAPKPEETSKNGNEINRPSQTAVLVTSQSDQIHIQNSSNQPANMEKTAPVIENNKPEFVSENTELINLDGMNLSNEEPAQVRAAA